MKQIWIALLALLLFSGNVLAQDLPAGEAGKTLIAPDAVRMSYPASQETHSYTYNVKEDGKAMVWLRADGVSMPMAGGEYRYTLPAGVDGEVQVWYRENGCATYRNDFCVLYGGNEWYEASQRQEDGILVVTIPARKVDKRDEKTPVTIGITFNVNGLTDKKWWGRVVKIATGKTTGMVTYLSIGVYMPEGVYTRDYSQGPKGWGAAMNAIATRDMAVSEKAALPIGGPSPAMFDYAGGGDIMRSRPNLMPGEAYEFTFMSSTSAWKLYTREIGIAALWMVSIALVIALLLKMIVGKKPVTWYLGVMVLLTILMVLIGGLWMTYRLNFGSSRFGYGGVTPLMMGKSYRDAGPTSVTPPAEPAVDLPAEIDATVTE